MNINTYRNAFSSALALTLVLFGAPVTFAQSPSLFVSFTDANDGTPVTDITADEVVIEVDGVHGETLNLEPIDWPVRVTIFVDNGVASVPELADMREGVTLFLEEMPPDVEVAIGTIGGRPQFQARHTTDRAELADAIGTIAPDMEGAAMFVDALYEEAERMHEDEEGQYFPIVVMVATNGPEGSSRVRERPFREMMERLFANSATVHTKMWAIISAGGIAQGGDQGQLGQSIGEATGGTFEALTSSNGFRNLLPALAQDIARKHRLVSSQYRVTFAPPEEASDQPAIRVLTTRSGVNMTPTMNGNIP